MIEPADGSADRGDDINDTESNNDSQKVPEDTAQVNKSSISIYDWSIKEPRKAKGNCKKPSPKSATPREGIAYDAYIPRGAPGLDNFTAERQPLYRRPRLDTYRLSMPPSIKFNAPEPSSRPLPLPRKNEQLSSSLAYRPHPAYPVEEWTIRTPSPVRSARESITTPPLENRKTLGITGGGLLGVISSTWKRSVSGVKTPPKSEGNQPPRDRSLSY